MLDCLDPFRDHALTQSVGHDDDRLDEGRRRGVLRHFLEERTINLDGADQTRVAITRAANVISQLLR